jgi:exodeoxyribonuclease VII large subunit
VLSKLLPRFRLLYMPAFSSQPDLFVDREPTQLTVTTLHREMKRALNKLGLLAVTGEVHEVKKYSGATYFTLKERASQVSVTVMASKAKFCHFKNGETVVVNGMLDTNQGNGRLSLMANSIVPTGEGAVAALIDRTRERLRAEGFLDRQRHPLPMLPGLVVVVCGNDAAVKHDFQTIADQRFAGYPIEFITATQTSAESLLNGLEVAQRVRGAAVIVLARGGGDATQLLPYSDESLCRAIALSKIPIVTAIGHEINIPLCDEVSDLRAPTPTAAATLVIPDRAQIESQLARSKLLCERSIVDLLDIEATRLQHRWEMIASAPMRRVESTRVVLSAQRWSDSMTQRLVDARRDVSLNQPGPQLEARLASCIVRVATAKHRLQPPATVVFHHQLAATRARLDSWSPQQVLQRGFAIVRTEDGQIVRSVKDVQVGAVLLVELADGTLRTVVAE